MTCDNYAFKFIMLHTEINFSNEKIQMGDVVTGQHFWTAKEILFDILSSFL